MCKFSMTSACDSVISSTTACPDSNDSEIQNEWSIHVLMDLIDHICMHYAELSIAFNLPRSIDVRSDMEIKHVKPLIVNRLL
jgi:hypothetical protein